MKQDILILIKFMTLLMWCQYLHLLFTNIHILLQGLEVIQGNMKTEMFLPGESLMMN